MTRRLSPQTRTILALLLEEPATWHYGYALSQRTGLKSGTLYPILMRLADQGWLETRWDEPARPGRPPRHIYRLTAAGAAVASAAQAEARKAGNEAFLLRPGIEPAGG